MPNFKSGFVSIIGRTNVGKSTLMNSLVGEKVAITANKCQTTRTAIRAIINRENSQIIFTDTPGIHKPKTKLGNTMLETVWQSVPNTDVTLFIIDATSEKIGTGDRIILDKIKELGEKSIIPVEKVLEKYPKVNFPPELYKKVSCGVAFPVDFVLAEPFTVYCNNEFFGLGTINEGIFSIKTYLRDND